MEDLPEVFYKQNSSPRSSSIRGPLTGLLWAEGVSQVIYRRRTFPGLSWRRNLAQTFYGPKTIPSFSVDRIPTTDHLVLLRVFYRQMKLQRPSTGSSEVLPPVFYAKKSFHKSSLYRSPNKDLRLTYFLVPEYIGVLQSIMGLEGI